VHFVSIQIIGGPKRRIDMDVFSACVGIVLSLVVIVGVVIKYKINENGLSDSNLEGNKNKFNLIRVFRILYIYIYFKHNIKTFQGTRKYLSYRDCIIIIISTNIIGTLIQHVAISRPTLRIIFRMIR